MGNGESRTEAVSDDGEPSALASVRASTNYCRMDGAEIAEFNLEDENEDGNSLHHASLVKMAYNGIWSVVIPSGRSPKPRNRHFTAYSKELQTIFIGYGQRHEGSFLDDVWALDVNTKQWAKLKLNGDVMSPRAGASATMMGNFIVVFGGFDDKGRYLADLHTIDVTTGEVILTRASGRQPTPRRTPVMGIWKRRLYIWGGHNGHGVPEISVLDFDTMRWGLLETSVKGRMAAGWVQIRHRIYVYGCSKRHDFIVVDMENCDTYRQEACGSIPNSTVVAPVLTKVGGYLMYFGGKLKNKWTMVHACELKRMWWFVFFIKPDGESTSVVDGRISSDGLFLLPRMWSFSACYVEQNRELIVTLGHPRRVPPPVSVVYVGDALAVLNLRQDMMDMFAFGLEDEQY